MVEAGGKKEEKKEEKLEEKPKEKEKKPKEKPEEMWERVSEALRQKEPSSVSWSGLKIALFAVIIIIVIVAIIFLALPFLTRAGFSTWGISQGISGIFGGYSFRKIWYELTHPFSIGPEEAEVEENPYVPKKTMEGIKVELEVYQKEVLYDQPFSIGIKIKNEGNRDIKRVDIEFANPYNPPKGFTTPVGCINISGMNCVGAEDSKLPKELNENFKYVFHVDNIPAGSEKDIICNNLRLSKTCKETYQNPGKYAHALSVRGVTYYVSNSRLPIEVMDNDYAQTLMKNERFYTTKQRATAEIGAPLRINLNTLAEQPLIDTIGYTSVIIGYDVLGSGKLATHGGQDKFPILIITTEKGGTIDMGLPVMYGEGCIREGENSSGTYECCFSSDYWGCEFCDSSFTQKVCISGLNESLAKYSDVAAETLNRYCELANTYSNKHVCFNTLLRQEFKGYVIPKIRIPDINVKRETFYVTVTAIYPYASTSDATIYGIIPS